MAQSACRWMTAHWGKHNTLRASWIRDKDKAVISKSPFALEELQSWGLQCSIKGQYLIRNIALLYFSLSAVLLAELL